MLISFVPGFNFRRHPISGFPLGSHGFSLVEMLLVAAISSVVIMAAATIAISETKASIKAYAIQALRDKYARLTYFIEGEVGEGGEIRVVRDAATCPTSGATPAAPSGVTEPVQYLFTVRHNNAPSQGLASRFTCYFNVPLVNNPGNDPNHWSLYRYGPAIGDNSGVIGLVNGDSAIPSDLNPGIYMVSPFVYVYNVALNNQAACGTSGLNGVEDATKYSCDGRTLTYRLKVGSGTTGRSSIWNATYPTGAADVAVYARARVS